MHQLFYKKGFISLMTVYTIGCFIGITQAQDKPPGMVILEDTKLTILGKTNINSFSCHLEKSHLNDTLLQIVNPIDLTSIFDGLVIPFRVADIKCDPELMTKDFKQILNEEDYPFIKMRIKKVHLTGSDNLAIEVDVVKPSSINPKR